MSAIKLSTPSSGSISLSPADTASNLTLTVPAQAGSIVTADSSGNVGIGTSSPTNKLSVNGSVNIGLSLDMNPTSGNPNITLRESNTFRGYIEANSNGMLFGTGPAATERFRLDNSGNFLFNSGYGSVATAYGCRVWVNFNGTGTVAIRNSGNVSSITDNGTGDYTVNFSSAMPDVNYCVGLTADFAQQMVKSAATFGGSGTNPTTSSIRVFTRDGSSSASDSTHVYVSIFR